MDQTIAIALTTSCFFLSSLLIFFGFFAYLRYLRHKETIALAERGLVHPDHSANGKGTLRWGLVFAGLGLALCLGLYPVGWLVQSPFPLHFGPWMLAGLIPAFFGLSLMAIYYLTGEPVIKDEASGKENNLNH
jgi:hypothetical protein